MYVRSLVTAQLDEHFTLHWVCHLSLGSPRESLKNHKISSLLPIPSTITKSVSKVNTNQQNDT